ncbi:MAG: hypothetical protein DRI23_09480 [Candidatus Cloacimonadota bacterium]|nr:MAG: hypothetical protein DRI23_09480 [Candidatus Cloacimonadota bacterium]
MKEYSIIKLWLLIIFLFTQSIFIYSQQETETPTDSIFRYQGITPNLNLDYKFDDLIHYNDLNLHSNNQLLYGDPSTIWLRTELILSSTISFDEKARTENHYTSILYQQYLEDSKFDPVRYVLGMAQLTAVGYLAYRHVKKYGFWK